MLGPLDDKGHPPSGKRGQGVHASSRRALPLLLLGVKLGFLGLHAVNELPECLVGLLVGYASAPPKLLG